MGRAPAIVGAAAGTALIVGGAHAIWQGHKENPDNFCKPIGESRTTDSEVNLQDCFFTWHDKGSDGLSKSLEEVESLRKSRMKYLLKVIRKTKKKQIDLSNNQIDMDELDGIVNELEKNTAIRSINLGNNSFGAEGFTRMLAVASENQRGVYDATHLSRILSHLKEKTSLVLDGNYISDAEATGLAQYFIQMSRHIEKLSLASNKIGAYGGTAIGKALIGHTSLTSLDLSSNKIGDAGATAIGDACIRNQGMLSGIAVSGNEVASLKVLWLNDNDIGDEGAKMLAGALRGNALTSLHLEKNKISAQGANLLADALAINTSLTDLNLSTNRIGDEGARAIGKALTENGSLTKLDLSGNKIHDAGATAIGEALKHNHTLTELNLSINRIDRDGATAIGKALESNDSLKSLALFYNTSEDNAAIATAIGKALETNDSLTLTKLDLQYNQIGEEGAKALAGGLQSNNSLQVLLFTDNRIGNKMNMRFEQICKSKNIQLII